MGLAGTLVTEIETGVLAAVQPTPLVTVTVYAPDVFTEMFCVVAPLLHK
jgi:hypothetical protein